MISENLESLETSVLEFEKSFSTYLKGIHVLALNSATSALHLALKVLGVGAGDQVLCSTFTFAASAFPIKYVGASPIFVDAESESWNMCPVLLETAIEETIKLGKRPKAIILVHSLGLPAKLQELLAVAKKYQIPVVEDAAEAIGSTYKGQFCGTLGDIGVISFNKNKIMTTYGGGVLLSSNETYIKKANYYASQSKENLSFYKHLEVGYNYKMNSLVALLGVQKLQKVTEEISERRAIYKEYVDSLQMIKEINLSAEPEFSYWNCWMVGMVLDSEIRRNKIMEALKNEEVTVRPMWNPLHRQPVFKNEKSFLNGVSDNLFKKGLTLPCDLSVSHEKLQTIINTIKTQFK